MERERARVQTAQEAAQNPSYLSALKALLYQLADDDLIFSHRGAEWLGLVPHLEEDVAYSSITQNTMGHALMFYQLLEELGEGQADDLAYLREADQYYHAILVERPNGEGDYAMDPDYDWAYTVIRNLAYETFKRLRLEGASQSSYQPLASAAEKMLREQFYHLQHWQVWVNQLGGATPESTRRLNEAVEKVWQDADSLFDLGPQGEEILKHHLIHFSDLTRQRWNKEMKTVLERAQLNWPGDPAPVEMSGRDGRHSEAFEKALAQLSEVYKLAPAAQW